MTAGDPKPAALSLHPKSGNLNPQIFRRSFFDQCGSGWHRVELWVGMHFAVSVVVLGFRMDAMHCRTDHVVRTLSHGCETILCECTSTNPQPYSSDCRYY